MTWARFALSKRDIVPAHHHLVIMQALERVDRGETTRLLLLLPPGSAKSTYSSLVFPPWWFARHPTSAVITACHTAGLAEHFGRGVRDLIAEHGARLGVRMRPDARAATRFLTESGGEYFGVGIHGAVTGRRADLALIDDPIASFAEAETLSAREHLWNWFRTELLTRLKPGGRMIVNASGVPMRLSMPLLRGLFSAGGNITISQSGTISAATDPAVTAELTTLSNDIVATDAEVAALAAKIPAGGFVGLNAQGYITDPTEGPVTLGTVQLTSTAPARTLQAMSLDTVNVVDFGAVPGGGDSTAAFNAAYAALPSTGGEIFIPAGDYQLASQLSWSGTPLTVRGAGKGITRLHLSHTGIGFDITQTNPFNKTVLRDFSAFAENTSGQTAAVAVLNYPQVGSFGYVSALITDIECFGYPNAQNGTSPFPQTFLRGFVLNNCWSTQINNVSCFGPPATAGTTSSAVIELNGSIDTRIIGLQCYYNHSAIIQTGYCEGIYVTNPLVVGADWFFTQTNEVNWQGYQPDKPMLLGLWAANGELNTNIGTVQLANVTDGFLVGLDITRDGGPAAAQTLFNWTNVSNFTVMGCNFVGGSSGGVTQDTAFSFSSTWDSSGNTIGACHFENLATIMNIGNANATVGLSTFALQISNVPLATAFIDNSNESVGNYLTFLTPATSTVPAGLANTKDHVLAGAAGQVLFRINNVTNAVNFIRHQPATTSNPPALCFDGTDGTVNGVIQTKGGNLYVNAAGNGASGNMLSLLNLSGASNWVQIQNATSSNLSEITTNAGGLAVQPVTSLYLSPGSGIFMPNLPTTKPAAGSHQIWNNNGVVSIA